MKRNLGLCLLTCLSLLGGCGGAEFGKASNSTGGNGVGAVGIAGAANSSGGKASSGGAWGTPGSAGGVSGADSLGGAVGVAGEGGDADAGAPASECPCAAPRPTCEAGTCVVRGPTMIKAGPFYVDSTEVTVQEYDAFLLAMGDDVSLQMPECVWNDSFEPAAPGAAPSHPVTQVDFCDATAFCAWADKQLCGKIGGGTLLFEELSIPTKSQWFAACAGPDAQLYPYGPTQQIGACNDNSAAAGLIGVGSFEGCNGFHQGVYDMIGNAAEWVDACDAAAGATDGCETAGGSYAEGSACTGSALKHRKERLPTVGFRCCSRQ